MADNLSGIGETIRRATEAFAEAISAMGKSVQSAVEKASGQDRERIVENWLRIARMSKDGVITAIDHGFEVWEREVRRMASTGGTQKTSANPMEAWAENLRKATESLIPGGTAGLGEEMRKQAENVQKTVAEGIRTWQKLWEGEKK
jgi:hypothetical protein